MTTSPIVGQAVIVVTEMPAGHFSVRSFGSPDGSRAAEVYCDRLARLAHAISTMSAEELEIASGTSVVDVPRLRAIEAAAREVLAYGRAQYDAPIDPDRYEGEWIGDLIPAAVIQALRTAVNGDMERAQ